jgi:hypothetical protein
MFTNEKHANNKSWMKEDACGTRHAEAPQGTWDPTLAEHRQLCAAYLSVV